MPMDAAGPLLHSRQRQGRIPRWLGAIAVHPGGPATILQRQAAGHPGSTGRLASRRCRRRLGLHGGCARLERFGPETGLVFGRASAPASHHLYYADPPIKSIKYFDPIQKKETLWKSA